MFYHISHASTILSIVLQMQLNEAIACWVRVIFSWFGDWDDSNFKPMFREIV